MGEFEVIKDIFAPLSSDFKGAFNLTDDAAVFSVSEGCELVVTKDAMVSGVHFLASDTPSNIAQKLLRTNLSDLAAMGAEPKCYLLALALTEECDLEWLKGFAAGLHADQLQFRLSLIGGDTVKTPGPLTLSLTLVGEVPKGKALRRNGAQAEDFLCVTGTIGDAAMGLQVAQGEITCSSEVLSETLKARYFMPEPRVSVGMALRDIATACLDISDGLLADVGHLCEQSNFCAEIDQQAIPLSVAASELLAADPDLWSLVFGGGDDYELAFTIAPENLSKIQHIEQETGTPIYVIGQIVRGKGVIVRGKEGKKIDIKSRGWTHI